jgi:hypothetical protein
MALGILTSITYVVVTIWSKAVIRAWRSSDVSPANSGSSSILNLYLDTSILMTAMTSVSAKVFSGRDYSVAVSEDTDLD